MTPRLLRTYQEEYEKERQEEADMIDYTAWLHGAYFLRAINAVASKNGQYPEKPLRQDEREKIEDENPTKTAALNFANYAAAFNKQFEKKGG